MRDPIDEILRYAEVDTERQHRLRPVCDICEELIEDEDFFMDPVTGAKVCKDCLEANMKKTRNYMRYEDD